ncbi:MAG TPA: DNA (cytosine-5-)-methyltransferase [Kiritimatiellia bacterium]|nr:DNA (cytosine-5-)-methyltransferase [Kiritimatiellia bacterium]
MSKKVIYRLGELFCGPGGLALGALRSRVRKGGISYSIEHAWANDFDPDTCATYTRNICPEGPQSVICRDVRELDLNTLGNINAFAYGFPCNDFSIVGEKRGFHGAFGPLYMYGVKIINHFKPTFFVAENVGGITSVNDGTAFKKILSDLKNAGNGYELTVHLYKFEEYGIPQARHRMIIVGLDRSLNRVFRVPAPFTTHKQVTARQALLVPPIPADAANNERTVQSKTVIERLKRTRPGENAWTANLPDHLKLNVKNTRLSHIYKRLHPDRPSYTITGSGGGGTHGYHWEEPRALTNRERARLQTFPDDFIFEGSKESVRKQIGMAVSPLMSEIVFTAILKTLAGIQYESVTPSWIESPELFEFSSFNGRLACATR